MHTRSPASNRSQIRSLRAATLTALATAISFSTVLSVQAAIIPPESATPLVSTTAAVTDLNGSFLGEFIEFDRPLDPDLNLKIKANTRAPFQARTTPKPGSLHSAGAEIDEVVRDLIPIPEPGPFELLMLGLLCLAIATRLRRRS